MKFDVKRLAPTGPFSKVFHVHTLSRYDLAMAFVRMQEWYESPVYHHKHFTLEEYMRWYAGAQGKGVFSYPNDWTGFNVPGEAVREVLLRMMPISKAEADLGMALLAAKAFDNDVFYVIGTSAEGCSDDKTVLEHEKAHGRFHVDPEYRKSVLATLRLYNTEKLRKRLVKEGYGRWTIPDEIHAYALTGWPEDFKPTQALKNLRHALRKLDK